MEFTPLHARAGDTFRRTLTWTDKTSSEPINLTGATIEWSLKRGELEHQFLTPPQVQILDEEGGVFQLELSYVQTRELFLESRMWQYEVTVQQPNTPFDDRTTVVEGFLRIARELVE